MLNINISNLHKAFKDFHTLTNIKIVLYDKNGKYLLSYPKEDITFCKLIGKIPEWSQKCNDCDYANFDSCSKLKKDVYYQCHLGLSEAIVPIYDAGGILGFVMFGQVLTEKNEHKTRKLLNQKFNSELYPDINKAIQNIPVKTEAELEASITILKALALYFLSNKWVTPAKNEFIRQIDQYIKEHISHTITAEDICSEFHIKRTRLYSIANEYLNCSIAEYIRNFRIAEACRLLTETNIPITDVAYSTGFSDYGHFSRIFKQIKGHSASAYRKSNK
ncbi:MAG: PocR ligand-binding domain-containing protein [Clostridia bacterium]|nr:PocR ligand-binding domain-containing protein [Clostridia bacterium]